MNKFMLIDFKISSVSIHMCIFKKILFIYLFTYLLTYLPFYYRHILAHFMWGYYLRVALKI